MKGLIMWAIFDHPSDYPNYYVARSYIVRDAGIQVIGGKLFKKIGEARSFMMYNGLVCMGRSQDDHPKLLEVWF